MTASTPAKSAQATPRALPAEAVTSNVRVLVNKQAASGAPGYQLYLYNAQPGLQLADESGFTNFGTTQALPKDDEWHLLAVSVWRAGRQGQFYVDGQPWGAPFDPSIRSGSLDNGSILRIGAASFGQQSPFDGWLDEVEVLRRPLSAAQVAELYRVGSHGKCGPTPMVTPTPQPTLTATGTVPPLQLR